MSKPGQLPEKTPVRSQVLSHPRRGLGEAGAAGLLYVAEPPARYLIPVPVVVDCSVLAGVLFSETWYDAALRSISGKALHAPDLLPYEVISVAHKKHRQGFVEPAADGLIQFADLDIELHDIAPAQVVALAIRYGLSTYDASYLWVAEQLKAPLLTFDQKLAAAATTHLAGLN